MDRKMILSILILSHVSRKHLFDQLYAILAPQLKPELEDKVEVLIDLSGDSTTKKRNGLVSDANGKYVWFVNDGDHVSETAVEDILKAADSDCDLIAINGMITIDGKNPVDFFMSMEHKINTPFINGDRMVLLKAPTYIAPIKKEIVVKIPFGNKASKWSQELVKSGLIKSQEVIDKPLYHLRHCAS